MQKTYGFEAVIQPVPEKGGAYVRFPYDIRKEFGKGRVKAEITFDGEPYSGSIVNMGLKNEMALFAISLGFGKRFGENREAAGRHRKSDRDSDSAIKGGRKPKPCGNAPSVDGSSKIQIKAIPAAPPRRP